MKNGLLSIFLFGAILGIVVSGIGCKHDPIIPDKPVISFKNDIQPILIPNCARSGCHDSSRHSEKFPIYTYADVMSHELVVSKDANNSRLYNVITGSGEKTMPPSQYGSLTNRQITIIYIWIMQGAKDN
ncbi:MAG: hypothetical protein WCL14_14680 [Bacteroidota bacterium]